MYPQRLSDMFLFVLAGGVAVVSYLLAVVIYLLVCTGYCLIRISAAAALKPAWRYILLEFPTKMTAVAHDGR